MKIGFLVQFRGMSFELPIKDSNALNGNTIMIPKKTLKINKVFKKSMLEKVKYFILESIDGECFNTQCTCFDTIEGVRYYQAKIADITIEYILGRAE